MTGGESSDAREPQQDPPRRRSRVALALVAVAVVAGGLVVTRVGDGEVTGAAGDALYAALVYVLVALVSPGSRARFVAVVALGLCLGVELAQLTGAPADAVSSWEPLRYVLGTTFQWTDLVAYAGGVLTAALVDGRREARRPTS